MRPERGGPHNHAVGGMGQVQHAIAVGIEFDLARAPGAISRAASKFATASRNASQRADRPPRRNAFVDLKEQERLFAHSLPKKRGYMESLTQPKFAR